MSQITKTSTGGTPGSGDVVGPASSTNNVFALFSGTTGKLLKVAPYQVGPFGEISPVFAGNSVIFGATDTVTTSPVQTINVITQSTGTPGIGFGSSFVESVENASGNFPNTWQRDITYLDPVNGTEDVQASISLLVAGTQTMVYSYSGVTFDVRRTLQNDLGRIFHASSGAPNIALTDTQHYYGAQTSGAGGTLILPASPENGRTYTIADIEFNAAANNITISGNGHSIVGTSAAATYVMNTNGASVTLVYFSIANVWKVTGSYP